MEILRKKCQNGEKVSSLSRCFQMCLCIGIFFSIGNGDNQVTGNNEGIIATPSGSTKRDDPGGGNISSYSIPSSESTITPTSNDIIKTTKDTITFSYPMKENHVRFEGETLRLTCEAQGNPPPLRIQWYKDHLPLENKNRRISSSRFVEIRAKTGCKRAPS